MAKQNVLLVLLNACGLFIWIIPQFILSKYLVPGEYAAFRFHIVSYQTATMLTSMGIASVMLNRKFDLSHFNGLGWVMLFFAGLILLTVSNLESSSLSVWISGIFGGLINIYLSHSNREEVVLTFAKKMLLSKLILMSSVFAIWKVTSSFTIAFFFAGVIQVLSFSMFRNFRELIYELFSLPGERIKLRISLAFAVQAFFSQLVSQGSIYMMYYLVKNSANLSDEWVASYMYYSLVSSVLAASNLPYIQLINGGQFASINSRIIKNLLLYFAVVLSVVVVVLFLYTKYFNFSYYHLWWLSLIFIFEWFFKVLTLFKIQSNILHNKVKRNFIYNLYSASILIVTVLTFYVFDVHTLMIFLPLIYSISFLTVVHVTILRRLPTYITS